MSTLTIHSFHFYFTLTTHTLFLFFILHILVYQLSQLTYFFCLTQPHNDCPTFAIQSYFNYVSCLILKLRSSHFHSTLTTHYSDTLLIALSPYIDFSYSHYSCSFITLLISISLYNYSILIHCLFRFHFLFSVNPFHFYNSRSGCCLGFDFSRVFKKISKGHRMIDTKS